MTNNLFRRGQHTSNLAMFLKIAMNVCSAMDYAHSNSVLHLNLYPSKVMWTAQDAIESQVYKMPNPANRSGIIVTEFGNLMIFDIANQNYKLSSSKEDIKMIETFWPPELRDAFKKLLSIQKPIDQLKSTPEFEKKHREFLQSLSQKVDLFLFGGLLLYIVNNGKTWSTSDEFDYTKMNRLVDTRKDFFEPKIYERVIKLIQRCLMSADTNEGDIGFNNFFEISRNIDQEFGYLVKRIESVHTQPQRPDVNPSRELPITIFRNHMADFYNDFYFANYESALKHFRAARKVRSQLGKGNEDALDSFEFNDRMIKWIQGKISASAALRESPQWLSAGLFAHNNTYKQLHRSIKLLPTVHDGKFIKTFENTFNQLVESYVYKDYNKKLTLINSADNCSISHVLVSAESNLFIVGSFQSGIQVYTLDREFKSSYHMDGLTALAADQGLGTVILGTSFGLVYTMEIDKVSGKIDEKSFKQKNQNFKHEGKVKVVSISDNSAQAISFGYLDQKLVIYDLMDLNKKEQVIDMSVKPGPINSFSFDGKGSRFIYSMDNCEHCILYDSLAPVHRRETKLEVRDCY